MSLLGLSLAAGVLSSSYFLCGNVATACFGVVPAVLANDNLPVATKVDLWAWFYERAKYHFVGSTVVSAVSFSTAACLTPSPSLRALLFSSAASSLLIVPYTYVFMLPVNRELVAMNDSASLRHGDKEDPSRIALLQVVAVDKLTTWSKLHRVRMLLGAGAWISGIVVVIASVSFDT